MVNPKKGTVHDRLRSFLGAEEPTVQKGEDPVKTNQGEAETPKGDTEANSRRVKAKLNDREIEFDVLTDDVDLDLIPKGLMMESDYRKKTHEVGEQRRNLEAKEQEIAKQLQNLEDILYGEAKYLDSEEMTSLQESDPEEYYRQRNKFDSKVKKVKKYRDEYNQELTKKQQEIISSEQAKWKQAIPEWLDEGKMNADLKKMGKTLKDAGFGENDMSGIYDHRLVMLIRKAALFDEISSKPIESKRHKEPPRSQKPGGGSQEPVKKSTARDRLKKTGKRHDAQAAFKEYLGL